MGSLMVYSPWSHRESYMTEQLTHATFHFIDSSHSVYPFISWHLNCFHFWFLGIMPIWAFLISKKLSPMFVISPFVLTYPSECKVVCHSSIKYFLVLYFKFLLVSFIIWIIIIFISCPGDCINICCGLCYSHLSSFIYWSPIPQHDGIRRWVVEK